MGLVRPPSESALERSAGMLLILVLCLLLPAAAWAATPFTAGTGIEPTVAVGTDGSGHVAWETSEEPVKVGYCRLSPGTSACNHTALLSFPGTSVHSAGRAQVFTPAASKVVIVAGCWGCGGDAANKVYDWISLNNGESFTGPTEIGYGLGNGNSFGGLGVWLDSSYTFVGTSGSHVKAQQGPFYTEGQGVNFATGGIFAYTPGVVRVPGGNKLVATVSDLDTIKYAVYGGPSLTVAQVNNAVNWESDLTLPAPEGDNGQTVLNSGPSGVTLTYLSFRPNDSQVGLRRFDPLTNSFGAPTYLEGSDPIDDEIDFSEPSSFQDPAGRIHVVWDSQYEDNRLRYTVSDTSGNNFSTPATLAKDEEFYQSEIAAGADGHGFATWSHGCCGGAIRIVPLDPYPESAPVAPSSSSPPPASAAPPAAGVPKVGGLSAAKSVLVPGQGTVFRFRSSRAGIAVLRFEKRFRGVKGKRRGRNACLPLTRRRLRALRRKAGGPGALRRLLKKRRCRGFSRIGQLRKRVGAGLSTIRFSGRLAGRKLSPGRYRASLVVTDSAGRVSEVETLRFKVVAKHRKHRSKNGRRGHRTPR